MEGGSMGREVRRVPLDWEHPKNERGHYIPLFDKEYHAASRAWIDGLITWEQGVRPDGAAETDCRYYWEWYGAPPEADYDEGPYRTRTWTPEEAVGYQLYETTSEGTPLSAVFEDFDALCEWAAANATTFSDFKAGAAEWKQMLSKGWVYHEEKMPNGATVLFS